MKYEESIRKVTNVRKLVNFVENLTGYSKARVTKAIRVRVHVLYCMRTGTRE